MLNYKNSWTLPVMNQRSHHLKRELSWKFHSKCINNLDKNYDFCYSSCLLSRLYMMLTVLLSNTIYASMPTQKGVNHSKHNGSLQCSLGFAYKKKQLLIGETNLLKTITALMAIDATMNIHVLSLLVIIENEVYIILIKSFYGNTCTLTIDKRRKVFIYEQVDT